VECNKKVADLPICLNDLRSVLAAAAGIVYKHYSRRARAVRKADGSPLTQADTETNAFLREKLHDLLPTAGWLSEETADDHGRLSREWVWVVDPLDGTKEFTRRIPEFVVSVGLVHKEQAVAGGIVNPVTGEGGIGAVDGKPAFWGIDCQDACAATLEEAEACVSRSEIEQGCILPYMYLAKQTHGVGSVAYKLLRVAAGMEDLTFSVQPKSEWDICGGVALLAASGKVYRRFDGHPLRFNQPHVRIPCGAAAGRAPLVEECIKHCRQEVNI